MLLSDFVLPSDLAAWVAGLLFALSFVIGMLGGLIGLALGTMRLPAMLLLGVPVPAAAGANILVSSLTAIAGSYRHLRDGRVKLPLMLAVGLPSFAGGFIGGFYSGRAPANLLIGLAGGLILWQGVEMGLLARRRMRSSHHIHQPEDELAGSAGRFTVVRLIGGGGVGFGIGLLGGSIGLLLGSVRLPLMIRILRVDPRIAAGSNLFIGMAMGALGWVGHLLYQSPDLSLLIILGLPAIAGSYLGAKLTGRISINILILIMGALLTVSGLMMLWRAVSTLF